MTELSYLECTASSVRALVRLSRADGARDPTVVRDAIDRGVALILDQQRPDGSWPGFWGINFIYGTYFCNRCAAWISAFRRAGRRSRGPNNGCNRRSVRDGGWGEHHSGCLTGSYIANPTSLIISTAWACLGLMHAETTPSAAVRRGIDYLLSRRTKVGSCPGKVSTGFFSVRQCWSINSTTVTFQPWLSINSKAPVVARVDYDVIIAGGGVAGISAAAALREFGWSVLIVEPGQRNERRLSGELIHPFGVAALNELGIASASGFAGATAVDGFVVFPGDHHAAPISLPYAGGRGLALDHARIRTAFQQAADALPYVRTQNGRVVAIESDGSRMLVAVQDAQGLRNLSCRLAVAADGASSAVRSHAGISHTRKAVSKITGFLITGEIFLSPALAMSSSVPGAAPCL